jgi:molybdopterin-binding protein
MNILPGQIHDFEVCESISLVKIKCEDQLLSSIIIESPKTAKYLKKGSPIRVLFKETEVIIGKTDSIEISLQNKLPCTITEIKKGSLLSRVSLAFDKHEIRSIITSNAVEKLDLRPGMLVLAMIKTNELMLAE